MAEGPRALDHLVLPCADLAGAAHAFAELGFLVGRRNRHPWGTENHVIQFPGAFIELIALAPDFAPLAESDDAFPFAGFLAGQGTSADPSGMIVLRSEDARADASGFRAGGLGAGRMLHFSRDGQAPDGTTRTVAFSLAFAQAPDMPDLGFFVCEQHHPENFWNPAMQQHPNGATGLAGIVVAAADPQAHAEFLARFAGQATPIVAEDRVVVPLGDGAMIVVDQQPGQSPALRAIYIAGATPGGVHRIGPLTLLFDGRPGGGDGGAVAPPS